MPTDRPKTQTSACSDFQEETLAAAFAGTLPDKLANQIAAHIETCLACQERIDRLRSNVAQVSPSTRPSDAIADARFDAFAARLRIPPPVFEDFEAGDFIGPYQVVARLGLGGSSTVYECIDRKLDRRVAVKVLTHPSFDQHRMARLEREARLLAKLDHPCIVRAIEIEPAEFPPYIVMELVPGGPSSRLLSQGPLAPNNAARLVANVARALDHAHQKGILHRDIKPSNLLIAGQFEPGKTPPDLLTLKISDFDLARSMNDDSRLTKSNNILGTPSYMSPEQAEGRNKAVGPASDIYSLGVVLYEFLVGRPPLVADNPIHTLILVTGVEPISPRAIQPGIRRDLDTICMKCLRKNPAERYATAQALADDLERFLEGRPITARPLGRVNRLYRWCRRNRSLASAIGGIFLLLVSLAAVSTYSAISQERLREVAENNARLYEKAARQAREEEDFSRNLFMSSFRNLENYVRDLEKPGAASSIPAITQKARSLNRLVLDQYILRARQNVELRGDVLNKLFRDSIGFLDLGYVKEADEIWRTLIDHARKLPPTSPEHEPALRIAMQCVTAKAMHLRREKQEAEAAELLSRFVDDLGLNFSRKDFPLEDLIVRVPLLANLIDSLRYSGRLAEAEARNDNYLRLSQQLTLYLDAQRAESGIPPTTP